MEAWRVSLGHMETGTRGEAYLFIINSPSRLAPLLRGDPQHLVLVDRELALLAPRRPSPVLGLRRAALPPLRVQAGLGELKLLHGAALLLEPPPGLVLLGLALLLLPRPVQAFDLLFLGEDVAEGALAAKDVAVDAGYRVDGGLEAEAARAKREEGLARETRRAGAPGGAGERALVGCEDGAAGVSFACDVRGVLVIGEVGRAYCATFWRWCCVGDGVLVSSMSGNGIDTDTRDRRKVSRWSVSWRFCGDWGALWAVTWLAAFVPRNEPWHRRFQETPVTCSTLSVSRLFHCISLSSAPSHAFAGERDTLRRVRSTASPSLSFSFPSTAANATPMS